MADTTAAIHVDTGDDFGRELQRLRDVQVAEAVAVAWESAARAIVASDVIYAWEAVEVVRAAAPKPAEVVADASADPEFGREASCDGPPGGVSERKPLDAYLSDQTGESSAPRAAERVSTEGETR